MREFYFGDVGGAVQPDASGERPNFLDAISRLADVLKQRPEYSWIEGHSDNIPIHTARFSSNWELATSRKRT